MRLLSVFEQYQKARTAFVQAVADLSTRPQNIETLQNAGSFNIAIYIGIRFQIYLFLFELTAYVNYLNLMTWFLMRIL